MLTDEQFFEFAGQVLLQAGRQALGPLSPQRRIIRVEPKDRVLQILAGPGSGKTEMLVWRVLYELHCRGTSAKRVMVTTFTRKAATELSVRLAERSDQFLSVALAKGVPARDPFVHDLRVGTIHSLCDALLSEFDFDYMSRGTQLIDEVETSTRMVTAHRFELGYNGPNKPARTVDRLLDNERLVALFRSPWMTDDDNWPSTTAERVDFLLAVLGQQMETWIPRCSSKGTPNGIDRLNGTKTSLTDDLRQAADRWEAYLDGQAILDFTTLQKRFHDRQDTLLKHLDHVLIDEFQDTNPIQFAIHTNWLRGAARVTVVGDDDQSIYRFRGSDVHCFAALEPFCQEKGYAFRREKLEDNWRSTKQIVGFSQAYRTSSTLAGLSMPKTVVAPPSAPEVAGPRLLTGKWDDLCKVVAAEAAALGAGRPPKAGAPRPPEVAVLMFSTSERETKRSTSAALELRTALEARHLRVFNARNKTAGRFGSPVFELLGLLSFLIDPVTKAPAGKNGRSVEVWASNPKESHSAHSPVATPHSKTGKRIFVTQDHVGIQKKVLKLGDGDIGAPSPAIRPILEYVSAIRAELLKTCKAGRRPRLTMAGLVARILSFDRYRKMGFTSDLFRQALFTSLLESNIAPTRRSTKSLDQPFELSIDDKGKLVWPEQYWTFLSVFGGLLGNSSLDDEEVESFARDAVSILTFHQSKGLEFDHVYLAGTGRAPAAHSVLRTLVFSGEAPGFTVVDGQPVHSDPEVTRLSTADYERELYVALTRAKSGLTFLFDPKDDRPNMKLNAVIAGLFKSAGRRKYPGFAGVEEATYHA